MNRYLTLAAAAFLASCSTATRPQPVQSVPVSIVPLQTHVFRSEVAASGTLQPARTVTVGAEIAGRLADVAVRVGDRVGAGEPLAHIDTAVYQAALSQAQGGAQSAAANRDAAAAQVRAAQAKYALAQVTASRMESLYETGDVSRQRRDETRADRDSARAAVASAQASLSASGGAIAESQGAVSSAQVPLSKASVYAPFSGVVTAKLVDAGAVVSPGSPIVTIQSDRDLEVDVSVPEDAAAALVPGQAVPARIDALGKSVSARVRAVVPSDSGTLHSAQVKLTLNAAPGMLAGMYVRVSLPAAARPAPAVPEAAVTNRAGQDGVFVVRHGRAEFIPVETGVSGDGSVEVRGLPALSVVAASNVSRLSDGTPVSPAPR